jgi:hypothetical protein
VWGPERQLSENYLALLTLQFLSDEESAVGTTRISYSVGSLTGFCPAEGWSVGKATCFLSNAVNHLFDKHDVSTNIG